MAELKLLLKPATEDDFRWAEELARELGIKKPHLIQLLLRFAQKTVQRDALVKGLQELIDSGEVPRMPRSGRPKKIKEGISDEQ